MQADHCLYELVFVYTPTPACGFKKLPLSLETVNFRWFFTSYLFPIEGGNNLCLVLVVHPNETINERHFLFTCALHLMLDEGLVCHSALLQSCITLTCESTSPSPIIFGRSESYKWRACSNIRGGRAEGTLQNNGARLFSLSCSFAQRLGGSQNVVRFG